jgi:glycosyltransferase involved in cell wall biosynthesis
MTLSAVIRSKDEAPRLRLTLASLEGQAALDEVVVVNDGSSDETADVLKEAAGRLPLTIVTHEVAKGRAAASNAGAGAASGEVLLFLDGDTLAGPELAQLHAAAHAGVREFVGRGETLHLRCTRFLADPEAGTPQPGEEARIARLSMAELDRMRVTRRQVREDFGAVARRAEPGIYPGAGPRRLYEIEMAALTDGSAGSVAWAAAAGSNLSVPKAAFVAVGGFNAAIDINEHRELALRLNAIGLPVRLVKGARTYHLTHRAGWRDPLVEQRWEQVFYAAHPILAVKLLAVFWAGLDPRSAAPPEARLTSLAALDAAARGDVRADWDAARAALGLPKLGAAAAAYDPA